MKIKFYFLLFFTTLIFMSVNQLQAQTYMQKSKLYYDLRVGLGGCNIKGDFPDKMMPAMNVKLSLSPMVRVANNLIIESDLGLTSFTNAYKENNYKKYKAQYFQVPLLFRSFFYKRYSVALGGTCNILTSAVEYIHNPESKTVKINDQMKSIFPSATAGIAYGNNGGYFGFVYDYGIGNIRNDEILWHASSFRVFLQLNITKMLGN